MVDTSSLIPEAVLVSLVETALSTPPGCWVEVGVYQGGSALRLYPHRGGRILHLFDTFQGIPICEPLQGDSHLPGAFSGAHALSTLDRLMPEAHFHIGVFPQTLPDDLVRIAFVHVDCDQYRCVLDCIYHLWPRMVVGGIMWFDDYSFLSGAKKAVLEHFSESQLQAGPDGRIYVIKD